MEDEKNLIEVWKKVVDVQQHFNDIQMKIRNVAVTLMTAVVAAAGYARHENWKVLLGGDEVSAAVLVVAAGCMAIVAFWFMDQWYHRYLRAAVKHGMSIEAKYKEKLPELGLATIITEYSQRPIAVLKLTSKIRLGAFYFLLLIALLILAFMFGSSK